MTTEPEDDVLWTVKDVAAFAQVPERKIWNKLRRPKYMHDRIPMVELDGKPRFIPSHIRHWKAIYGHTLHKLTPQEEFRHWRQFVAKAAGSE
jgi:hypothetical protein